METCHDLIANIFASVWKGSVSQHATEPATSMAQHWCLGLIMRQSGPDGGGLKSWRSETWSPTKSCQWIRYYVNFMLYHITLWYIGWLLPSLFDTSDTSDTSDFGRPSHFVFDGFERAWGMCPEVTDVSVEHLADALASVVLLEQFFVSLVQCPRWGPDGRAMMGMAQTNMNLDFTIHLYIYILMYIWFYQYLSISISTYMIISIVLCNTFAILDLYFRYSLKSF